MGMGIYQPLGVRPIVNAAGHETTLHRGCALRGEEGQRRNPGLAAWGLRAGGAGRAHAAASLARLGGSILHPDVAMSAAAMAGADPTRIRQLPDTTGLDRLVVAFEAHRKPSTSPCAWRAAPSSTSSPRPPPSAPPCAGRASPGSSTPSRGSTSPPALDLPAVVALGPAGGPAGPFPRGRRGAAAGQLAPVRHEGADLVAFSGGKASRGPQASGVILGRADLIAACAANDGPNMGRPRDGGGHLGPERSGGRTGQEVLTSALKARTPRIACQLSHEPCSRLLAADREELHKR